MQVPGEGAVFALIRHSCCLALQLLGLVFALIDGSRQVDRTIGIAMLRNVEVTFKHPAGVRLAALIAGR